LSDSDSEIKEDEVLGKQVKNGNLRELQLDANKSNRCPNASSFTNQELGKSKTDVRGLKNQL